MFSVLLPMPVRKSIRTLRRTVRGRMPTAFRSWRSIQPIRRNFGWDTGEQCVDRYYIEGFLERHAADIRGRVLEIGDNSYTRRYGGDRVRQSDVLHAKAGNPSATIVGDLASGEGLPSGAFDCVILTQTLSFIYDLPAAVRTLGRILAPGGTVLVTNPGISQISRYDTEQWGDFWRLTSLSARRLFCETFPGKNVEVEAHGNIASAIALLHGLVARELSAEELDHRDPDYEVTIAVRAVKS